MDEVIRKAVKQIAQTPLSQFHSTLSPSQLTLIPFLSLASSLYSFSLFVRRQLYRFKILSQHRLPVAVISVGNLTWGGNGKTPMVEFLARSFSTSQISPLILTRGYGGGDEAKMLTRQLRGTLARIGVGANRVAVANPFIKQYGYVSCGDAVGLDKGLMDKGIGVAILDDGMQHLRIWRDLEIVMVNAMMPWGNRQLLPLGPLREPLTALRRADIVVVHHSDLVTDVDIDALESTILEMKRPVPIFFTKMAPTHFLALGDVSSKIPLTTICNRIVLCMSGIGFADSFRQTIERMEPTHVHNLEFSDHHLFLLKDIQMVRTRLQTLESNFAERPVVVITEKDYDRAPQVFEQLKPYQTLVLCSRLCFLERNGSTEGGFKDLLDEHLKQKLPVNVSSE